MKDKNMTESELQKSIDIAIDALKKQIPIDPYIEGDGYADGYLVYDTWICPNCETRYEIGYDDYHYCPCCGQHIDKTKLS